MNAGRKMLKKGDFIIILSVLLLALASSALVLSPKSGKTVTVKENNKTVYSGSLYENKTIKLAGNTVEIENGKVIQAKILTDSDLEGLA